MKTIHTGDCLAILPTLDAESVQCCVTSPPYYGLRDYGNSAQIGLEPTPDAYVERMVQVFREVRRVLKPDATLWLNLGDSYAGSGKGAWDNPNGVAIKETYRPPPDAPQTKIEKTPYGFKPKDLFGIPWRMAFALQADGWWLRSDIIWHKPNPMPESVTDRCTKAHEYLFMLTKSERYFYDNEAIKEKGQPGPFAFEDVDSKNKDGRKTGDAVGKESHKSGTRTGKNLSDAYKGVSWAVVGRNKRDVWTIATEPCAEAHFAVMPTALVEPCILAGTRAGDTVIDPFTGSGTVGVVCAKWGRKFIGCELNPEYVTIAERRIAAAQQSAAMPLLDGNP